MSDCLKISYKSPEYDKNNHFGHKLDKLKI